MKRIDLKYLESAEDATLSPYAARSFLSRGRKFTEEPHQYRTEFQRDRERIIHSRAFRRLEYKTQVFINHEGDHYRTRLTHTIEVAQISRTIARAMRLNEDLAESIALAHDLGHTPFGHAGERQLDVLLKDHGGFEHNRQSLRIVDVLERSYEPFEGLNLTWETREGIIKHSPDLDKNKYAEFSPGEQPSLEAQIIDLADEIAYNNHDLDDGFSSGILSLDELMSLGIWQLARKRFSDQLPAEPKLAVRMIIRNIINLLVSDLIDVTLNRIDEMGLADYMDIRKADTAMAGFSSDVRSATDETKRFLKKRLYQHYRVTRMSIKAEKVIRDLFTIYMEHPDTLPDDYQKRIASDGVLLTVTDYIAGMTDRFALEEHQKLTDPTIGV